MLFNSINRSNIVVRNISRFICRHVSCVPPLAIPTIHNVYINTFHTVYAQYRSNFYGYLLSSKSTSQNRITFNIIQPLLDLAANMAGLQQTFKHTRDGLTDKEKMKLNIS